MAGPPSTVGSASGRVPWIKTIALRGMLFALMAGMTGCSIRAPFASASVSGTAAQNMASLAQFNDDLAACRRIASSTRLAAEVIDMAANAAILAGAFFYALGGGRIESLQVAGASGLLVLFTRGQDAASQREAMVQACMRERGHLPAPPTVVQAQPMAKRVAPTVPDPSGPDKYLARKLAIDNGCHPQPIVNLAARAPGVETYAVACVNGSVLKMQCQYGNCAAVQ